MPERCFGKIMKFVSNETINAPLEKVWNTLTNTPVLQDWAQSRNLTLTRSDDGASVDVGTSWSATIAVSIVKGILKAEVVKIIPSKRLVIEASIRGIDSTIRLTVNANASGETRLRIGTTLSSSSIMGPVALLAIRTQEDPIARRHESLTTSLAQYISET